MSSVDDVGAQLARILASPQFARSKRLGRFLQLAVTAATAPASEALKEYRIGVEVFDRGRDFDPRIDPIVRVQAAKLRSRLTEYYAAVGVHDDIVISVPKGSYVAEITRRGTAAAPGSAAASHIAVLPFVNMSADTANEYFSDGLTEELINRLTAVPQLRVVARTSAFRFKGRNEDVREIGARLDAGTVIEGSVRQSGEQIRVTAQVIDVRTGYHRLSRTYQRENRDLFALQDELAQAVVDEVMRDGAAGTAVIGANDARRTNLEAFNLYLRGMYAMSNRFADLRECVPLLRESLVADPHFAPAWAGLANAYWMLAWFFLMPWNEAMPLSRQAAVRTLELDPASAHGHASLGIVECGFEWNWESGERHFREAIGLQPGLAIVYPFYAFCCLLPQGRMDEACVMADRGLALDPFNPLFHAIAILIDAHAGRLDEALRQYTLALEVDPNFAPIVGAGAVVLERLGRLEEAIKLLHRLCTLTQDRPAPSSLLGHALAAAGCRDEAEQILQRLISRPDAPDLDVARIYCGLRDTKQTLKRLEAAIDARDVHLLTVPTDRRFDWLRSNPAFAKLMRRMSLPASLRR